MHPFRLKDWISPRASAAIGCLLLLSGVVACYGWVAGNTGATQLFLRGAIVSPLGGTAFILLGLTFACPQICSAKTANHISLGMACGLLLIGAVGIVGFAGNVFVRLSHAHLYLWKMHVVGVFVALLSGLVLMNLRVSPTRANIFIVKFGTVCVVASGVLLVLNQYINTDYIFMTNGIKAPAFGGAAFAVATGIGLWGLWRDVPWNQRSIDAEPSHIYFAMEGLVTLIVASVALIAFSLSQGRSQEIMIDQMSVVSKDKRLFFDATLRSAYDNALRATGGPFFASLLDRPTGDPVEGSAERIEAALRSLVKHGFAGLSVTDRAGTVVGSAGRFVLASAQRVQLANKAGAELLWDDGYVFRSYLPIVVDGKEVGHVTAEQRLDDLTKLQLEVINGEGTSDMVVCSLDGARLRCFPSRWGRTSSFYNAILDGKPLPLTRAASGETAAEITTDFRRERVLAALGPIGDTGVGMAVKRDMTDLYAPIRKQFFNTLPILILLILASVAMTRSIVRPLVESLNSAGAKMKAMALTDALTGLANRSLFNDRLQSSMLRSRRSGARIALMFIDLDKFKTVNDKYGHSAGDDLLKWCASEIKSAVRESDTVARLGGDEFTAILENVPNLQLVERVAKTIVDTIGRYRTTFPLIDVADFGVSIGIALYSGDATTANELLNAADAALYSCKRAGRASFGVANQMRAEAVTAL